MILEVEKILKAHKTGLLVMDSATALYRTDLEKGRDAMQALTRQMIHLLGMPNDTRSQSSSPTKFTWTPRKTSFTVWEGPLLNISPRRL